MSKFLILLFAFALLNNMGKADKHGEGGCEGGDEKDSGSSDEGCGGNEVSGSGSSGTDNGDIELNDEDLESEVYLFAGILGGFVLLISMVVVYLTVEVVGLKSKLSALEKKHLELAKRMLSTIPAGHFDYLTTKYPRLDTAPPPAYNEVEKTNHHV